MQDDKNNDSNPEILPPEDSGDNNHSTEIPTNILLAQISNYTNRPDLFLETIEKHDPGFIKRMNEDAEEFSKTTRKSMFNFGRLQAYTGLAVSFIAAVTLLGLTFAAVFFNNIGFFQTISLAIFFAITQSGTKGFGAIASQIAKITNKNDGDKE